MMPHMSLLTLVAACCQLYYRCHRCSCLPAQLLAAANTTRASCRCCLRVLQWSRRPALLDSAS